MEPPPNVPNGLALSDVPSVKAKKRRNRQRLSCTECTKRRQKCDRQRPCGLCTSRGVIHLCRWESDYPRPPDGISAAPSASVISHETSHLLGTIDVLQAKVRSLEDSLQRGVPLQSAGINALPSPASTASNGASPNFGSLLPQAMPAPQQQQPIAPRPPPPGNMPNDSIYSAAINLTQTSLASAGGEYVGQGSIVCLMYKMSEGDVRYPYVQSTALYSRQPPHAQSLAINTLLQRLPPRNQCEPILADFFSHHNWRFGVPEIVFRRNFSDMWEIIAAHDNVQVNPHWLGLLFSCLAVTATTSVMATEYFYNAVTARRVAEDMLLAPAFTPMGERKVGASADGATLGCFAAVLQATYLADRGMVSEGWKLVGNALRSAIAIGMHRDPSWITWTNMNEEEKILRRRAWWSLIIFDRLHSLILGRPSSIRTEQWDVRSPDQSKYGHCSYGMFEEALVKLSNVVDEAHRTCLGIATPTPTMVAAVDEEFNKWESSLPIPFRWRLTATPEDLRSWASTYVHSPGCCTSLGDGKVEPDASAAANELTILRQRHSLATWFLACRLILHRQFIVPYRRTGGNCVRNLSGCGQITDVEERAYSKQSEAVCFDLCLELCTVLIAGHGVDSNLTAPGSESSSKKVLPGKISGFMDSFFLFDCAVSLMLCLCSFPPGDSRARVAYDAVERAGNILGKLARTTPNDPQGDISRRAIAVLLVLKRYQEQLMKGVGASVGRTESSSIPPSAGNVLGSGPQSMQVDPQLGQLSPPQLQQHPTGTTQLVNQNGNHATTSSLPFPQRPASAVSTPSSYERYSRYLDTTASSRHISAAGLSGFPSGSPSLGPGSNTAFGSSVGGGAEGLFEGFSFLNSFAFPEDPSIALREFNSPSFDWGADWSALSTAVNGS